MIRNTDNLHMFVAELTASMDKENTNVESINPMAFEGFFLFQKGHFEQKEIVVIVISKVYKSLLVQIDDFSCLRDYRIDNFCKFFLYAMLISIFL